MKRHDIRLRRERMSSRRIQQYKNYGDLLNRHRKSRQKRIITIIIYSAFLLIILIILYFMMGIKV